jgi:signal transduction histidine kinase
VSSVPVAGAEELAQLGRLVERLPTGVIVVGKVRLEIRYANTAAKRLLHPVKLRAHEPLPDPWPSFSLPGYAAQLVARGVVAETHVDTGDDRVYALDGLNTRSQSTVVILLRNITAQDRRGRSEREFIANAAHELLTPLTGIVSAAHVLEAGAKDVPEDRDRFVAHIATECNRLAQIARSLLVLARAQSGEEPPRLEIVALRPILDEAVALIEADVLVQCAPDVTVLADVDLLMQALTNLIANAAQHGVEGSLTIDAQAVSAKLVELRVQAGDGRRAELDEFRPRFRSAAGRDGDGFGLGLSIAEQSLEVMGGNLLLGGSAVRVRIPRGVLAPE